MRATDKDVDRGVDSDRDFVSIFVFVVGNICKKIQVLRDTRDIYMLT